MFDCFQRCFISFVKILEFSKETDVVLFLAIFSLTTIMSLSSLCRGNIQNALLYVAKLCFETWKTQIFCLAKPTILMHYGVILQNFPGVSRTF